MNSSSSISQLLKTKSPEQIEEAKQILFKDAYELIDRNKHLIEYDHFTNFIIVKSSFMICIAISFNFSYQMCREALISYAKNNKLYEKIDGLAHIKIN